MSTKNEDGSDPPADTTESALHNALTDMHRSGANVQTSSANTGDDSDADTSTMPGESRGIALRQKRKTKERKEKKSKEKKRQEKKRKDKKRKEKKTPLGVITGASRPTCSLRLDIALSVLEKQCWYSLQQQ